MDSIQFLLAQASAFSELFFPVLILLGWLFGTAVCVMIIIGLLFFPWWVRNIRDDVVAMRATQREESIQRAQLWQHQMEEARIQTQLLRDIAAALGTAEIERQPVE